MITAATQDLWLVAVPAAAAAFAGSVGATRIVLAWLSRRQILDHPNDRSSHTTPTPRGGGLAVTAVAACGLAGIGLALPGSSLLPAIGALVLMAVSWLDDRRSLPPLPRLLAQALVVAVSLAALGDRGLAFQGALPLWADRVLCGLGWLWFINLYNFMDGIDGITGAETAALGVGLALLGTLRPEAAGLIPGAAVVAAAGLGFLVWNWQPARIFLGDAGSIPLGFMLGYMLLEAAMAGYLAAALILPAYYLADASITLLWRLRDGERIWQAHRRHFYQRAVRGGKSHAAVVLALCAANVLLIGCALATAAGWTALGVAGAVAVLAGILGLLSRWAKGSAA